MHYSYLGKYFKLLLVLIFSISILKAQDLTRQNPILKTVYLLGKSGENHFFKPSRLTFDVGKLYILKIKNDSDSKHYFSSNSFSKSIFTRKIQIVSDKSKIAEIKGNIHEVEIWPNQQIEWWFVPVKTGYFKDLGCRVIDKKKNISHKDMGMIGEIIIK